MNLTELKHLIRKEIRVLTETGTFQEKIANFMKGSKVTQVSLRSITFDNGVRIDLTPGQINKINTTIISWNNIKDIDVMHPPWRLSNR